MALEDIQIPLIRKVKLKYAATSWSLIVLSVQYYEMHVRGYSNITNYWPHIFFCVPY
jgi:hypothetical protein